MEVYWDEHREPKRNRRGIVLGVLAALIVLAAAAWLVGGLG